VQRLAICNTRRKKERKQKGVIGQEIKKGGAVSLLDSQNSTVALKEFLRSSKKMYSM